jgi:hypothetical protein
MHPAPEEGARGAHRRRIHIGLWEHAPAEERGDFLRIHAVVLGFAALDGCHVEGRPEDQGKTFAHTQISQPIPREETFDRDDKIITIRRNDLEEGLGVCLEVLMHHDRSIVVQDADVQHPGVKIDSTVG